MLARMLQSGERTREPAVEDVSAVRGRRGRLGRREQVRLRDAPLRAICLVRRDFVDDVEDRVCCGLNLREQVRLGSKETVWTALARERERITRGCAERLTCMLERSTGGRGSPVCGSPTISDAGWAAQGEQAHLMKWRKFSRGRVPRASCLTKSCSTYSFQTGGSRMSRLVNGWGLTTVGLKKNRYYRRTSSRGRRKLTRGRYVG